MTGDNSRGPEAAIEATIAHQEQPATSWKTDGPGLPPATALPGLWSRVRSRRDVLAAPPRSPARRQAKPGFCPDEEGVVLPFPASASWLWCQQIPKDRQAA